jgi:uncharacterized protein (DUF433 family)
VRRKLMATVEYAHISYNSDNVPVIAGTRTKVRLIAEDLVYRGWDAEETHRQYPYLTLGQIHSALAYYFDHKEEMDAEIHRLEEESHRLLAEFEKRQGGFPTKQESLDRFQKKTGQLP